MSTSISSVSSGSSATPTTSKSSLGKDDFLKLLMAQIANQDPLSPMDNSQFVAQLAQFANVEQLQSANNNLGNILVGQAAANQTAAATLVGKDVSFNSDQISLTSGSSTSVRGNLGSDAASVTATITDDNGKVVRTLKFGGAAAGQFSSTWDGRDDAGTLLPTGNYHLKLAATDSSGKAVTTVTEGYGRVTGISYATGTAELLVGGTHVQLADVLEIDQPTSN